MTVPQNGATVPSQTERQTTRTKRFKILGAVLVVAAVVAGTVFYLTSSSESTDDAFIDGDAVQVSPMIGGRVVSVGFGDFATVKAGEPLLDIDPRDAQAQVNAARANVAASEARVRQAQASVDLIHVTAQVEKARADKAVRGLKEQREQAKFTAAAAKADLERAKSDSERYRRLYEATFASRQKLEQVEAEAQGTTARFMAAQAADSSAEFAVGQASDLYKSASMVEPQIAIREADLALAQAQLEQARADLDAAQLSLSYTHLTAPIDGRVSKRSALPGDIVQKGQVVTQLVGVTPWVVANFKENQLTRLRPGQPVSIKIDAFPGVKLTGHVDSVQPATGARFSLLPPENATGNFVKVVQRIPVKIVLDDVGPLAGKLSLGMSVTPTVDVGSAP